MIREMPQSQIDDKLYSEVYNYIKKNKISLEDFSKRVGITHYIMQKAMDRNIKMFLYTTTINKIRVIANG